MTVDPDEQLAASRIGTQIGTWTLERVLGVGSMASVFLARRADGCVAALKVLHPHLARYDELRKRFLREGPIGSALAAVGPLREGLPQVMESGVSVEGWPRGLEESAHPALIAMTPEAAALIAAADAAARARRQARVQMRYFRAIGERRRWVNRVNAARKETHGALAKLPHE